MERPEIYCDYGMTGFETNDIEYHAESEMEIFPVRKPLYIIILHSTTGLPLQQTGPLSLVQIHPDTVLSLVEP